MDNWVSDIVNGKPESEEEKRRRTIAEHLCKIPDKIAASIAQKTEEWKKTNENIFKDYKAKIREIKISLVDGEKFCNLTVDCVDTMLAYLSAYYDHIVSLQGIIHAKQAIYNEILDSAIRQLKISDLISGRGKDDWEACALISFPELSVLKRELSESNYFLSLYGVSSSLQVNILDGVKLMIETLKKRHETLLRSFYEQKH